MSEETNWADYDAFLREADKDSRVGQHKFLVTEKLPGVWPSGDEYTKIRGNLVTAGNAKTDFNLSALPSKAEMEAAKGDNAKMRGMAMSINILKSLAKHYSKSLDTLEIGDVIVVETRKDKNGFIRVVRIVDPKLADAKDRAEADRSGVPF